MVIRISRLTEVYHSLINCANLFVGIGISDENAVREHYRDSFAAAGIGILQCDLSETNGHKSVKTIGKINESGEPAGYIGSLAIPLSDRSFVFNLFSQEIGITGVRETEVWVKLKLDGHKFEVDTESGKMIGWTQDPYFPDYDGPCLRNLSDSEEYDDQFPDHPLTKVRKRINELPRYILMDEMREDRKPWWKAW